MRDLLYYGSEAVMLEESRPVYLRLRDIITAAILDGTYADGGMLPSVRAFAAEQGANPLTVAKAYQSFQDDGIVQVRRGVGMFLAEGARERLRAMERERFLSSVWPEVTRQMQRIGLCSHDLPAPARALSGREHA